MISEEDIDRALEYLRDSAKPAAVARSQAKMLEKYVSVVEAQQKQLRMGEGSNAAAQDAARASPEYRQALDAWAEAVKQDGEYTMLREAAAARIEAWRTHEATKRAEGRAYG